MILKDKFGYELKDNDFVVYATRNGKLKYAQIKKINQEKQYLYVKNLEKENAAPTILRNMKRVALYVGQEKEIENVKYEIIKGSIAGPKLLEGKNVILQIVNDQGIYSGGVQSVLNNKYPMIKQAYHDWFWNFTTSFNLGDVQILQVSSLKDIEVFTINLLCQHGMQTTWKKDLLDYDAMKKCLEKVYEFCQKENVKMIHAPKLGCGYAGGDWKKVEDLIKTILVNKNLSVTIYEV